MGIEWVFPHLQKLKKIRSRSLKKEALLFLLMERDRGMDEVRRWTEERGGGGGGNEEASNGIVGVFS